MKKSGIWLTIVAVLIVLGVAIYAINNNNKNKQASTSSNSTNSSSSAVNNSVVITKSNSTAGSYLANPSNMALYTIGSGTTGVSNCSASCLSAWPPYIDTGATTGLPTNISTIKRADNSDIQYTYKGMPLYTFTSDTTGQVSGNGVSGFSVAKP
jgi:predicted lipoprotein with Yx(FWY)xxD motif